MVCSPFGLWDYVVNVEHLEREMFLASVAVPFLLTVEDMSVLPVVLGSVNVRPLGNVRPCGD